MAGRRNGKKGDAPWWVWVVGLMVLMGSGFWWVWPLGIGLVLWRFIKNNTGQGEKSVSSQAQQESRMEKYLIMTEGRNVESVAYLASAVGAPYETVLRDLQKMVSQGRFGQSAYINYVDRTLVIRPTASQPAQTPQNRPSGGKDGSNMISRSAQTDAKKKGEAPAAPGSDSKLKTFLLIAGILLIGVGVLRLSLGGETLLGVVSGVLTALGGLGVLGFRGYLKKREHRFKLYDAACAGRDWVSIEELAKKAGISPRRCHQDLEAMLERGLLPKSAYIDNGEGCLILKPGAAPQKETPATQPEADNEDRYKAILRQIRKLNDDIPDEAVSRRIDEMEDLTGRIFNAVREKPEKEPQIKSFMSYYLPTTLKLLRSYADFEQSGADGENIRAAKAEIERILDTLVDGFKKQLDKLYESDAMDISSDIDVLESMLRRDGLAGDGSAFQKKG